MTCNVFGGTLSLTQSIMTMYVCEGQSTSLRYHMSVCTSLSHIYFCLFLSNCGVCLSVNVFNIIVCK